MDRFSPRLPPLNALRAFEAASRHLTFTKAAEELHVTHGAVSRQVLALEAHLDALLFVRGARGLTLTAEGTRLARAVTAAFETLRVAVEPFGSGTTDAVLRLSVPPTFAMRWLIPRLAALHRSHPALTVEITTSTAPVDAAGDRYDVAIRRIGTAPAGWTAARFLDGRSLPVCSPAFRRREGLKSARDLGRATLIVTGTERRAWPDWLRRHALKRVAEAADLTFEEMYFAVQAALDSLGVALVPQAIVAEEIRARRLVALADPEPAVRTTYALLAPRLSPRRDAVRELADWLRTQGALPKH